MIDSLPSAEMLDRTLDQRVSGFVYSTTSAPKIPEIIAQQHVCSSIIGRRAKVVRKITFIEVVFCIFSPSKVVVPPFVNAIDTARELLFSVIRSVAHDFGNARDVDQAVVPMERVRREPEDQIASLRLHANHGLADSKRKQTVLHTRGTTVIGCELVEVHPGHGRPPLII
jgi:hypothetical protein